MKNIVHPNYFCAAMIFMALSSSLPAYANNAMPSSTQFAPPRHGKPGSLVSISSTTSKKKLTIGSMNVDLRLHSSETVQKVSLSYQTDGAIRVEASAPIVVKPDSTGVSIIQIPVTVLSKGLHYLNVFAVANGQTIAYSVRMDARDDSIIQKPRATQTGNGFVELPARESKQQ